MKRLAIELIERLAWGLGILLSPLLNYRMQNRLRLLSNTVVTAANRKAFRHIGRGAKIARNVTLINPQCISLAEGATIGEKSVISAWPNYGSSASDAGIDIGRNTSIGAYCHLTAVTQISIGNGVLTGMYVTISDNAHGASALDQLDTPPIDRPLVQKGPVEIGDNVWIGSKVTILSGVHIGKGAIIAANAVVVHDVPEGTVVAGIPATQIKDMKL
jgi:acetyltransferase-like isoleucine patch superfamily enzyme